MSLRMLSRFWPELLILRKYSRALAGISRRMPSPAKPSTAFIGVRISWLMLARKTLLACVAASAALRASSSCALAQVSDAVRSSTTPSSALRRALQTPDAPAADRRHAADGRPRIQRQRPPLPPRRRADREMQRQRFGFDAETVARVGVKGVVAGRKASVNALAFRRPRRTRFVGAGQFRAVARALVALIGKQAEIEDEIVFFGIERRIRQAAVSRRHRRVPKVAETAATKAARVSSRGS